MSSDTCAVCLDVLKDPRTVPCGNDHVFCLSCVQGLASHSRNLNSFPCPCCRNLVRIPPGGVSAFGRRTSARTGTGRRPGTLSAGDRLASDFASFSDASNVAAMLMSPFFASPPRRHHERDSHFENLFQSFAGEMEAVLDIAQLLMVIPEVHPRTSFRVDDEPPLGATGGSSEELDMDEVMFLIAQLDS